MALVTGGGRGIGRAVALALARAGADVAVAARTSEQVEETADAVRGLDQQAAAVVCDVSDRAQVDSMVERVARELGGPTILVNNAGVAASAKLSQTTDELWDRLLRINATGAFYCSRAVLPFMLAAGWGRVINVASVASRAGAPYLAAYTASKHALLGLTRAVAAEVVSRGVTVNAICPGYVDTALTDHSIENITAQTGRTPAETRGILERFSPQNRLMTVEEVAGMAVFLCSEEARGITGQSIVIDGGGIQA